MRQIPSLVLDAGTSLEVDLTGAVAANQLPFIVSFLVLNKSTLEPVDNGAVTETGQTNSTTAVTVAAAPATNTIRGITYFSIKNSDTAAVEGWVQINDNATLREIWKGTLAVGDTLVYMDGAGWSTIDSTGHVKTTGGVNGPGSSTDNAIARWNGTAGNSIQDASNATISDAGQLALTVTGSAGGILIGGDAQWYRSAADVMRTPDSVTVDGNLTLSGSTGVTVGSIGNVFLTISGANQRYFSLTGDASNTGSVVMQAGPGSQGYGGAIVAYGHSHATFPGWVKAGISTASGGKFGVNDQGLGGGTDVFTVNANGNVVANGNLTVSGAGGITLTATASPTGTGAGAVGQIAWDTAFLYICTATNDWRRIALVDF